MAEKKRGPLSPQERGFIKANAATMTAEAIAKKLFRNVATVQKYIEREVGGWKEEGPEVQRQAIKQELRNSQKWESLKEEFTAKELKRFEEEYIQLMSQFKGDVLPTEEMQVFQAIKFELLMTRNLIDKRKIRDEVERLERIQGDFLKGGVDKEDREYALALENQIQGARASEAHKSTEFTILQKEHQRLMKDLKGTRDQRFKDVENSKISFLGLLKSLSQAERQAEEGRQMELMRMAGQKEQGRLGELHEYADGSLDRPILNCDTVGKNE